MSHDDLMTLLMVCKFWAAVAERPKLWTEFRLLVAYSSRQIAYCWCDLRLVISKYNSSQKIISHLLGLRR